MLSEQCWSDSPHTAAELYRPFICQPVAIEPPRLQWDEPKDLWGSSLPFNSSGESMLSAGSAPGSVATSFASSSDSYDQQDNSNSASPQNSAEFSASLANTFANLPFEQKIRGSLGSPLGTPGKKIRNVRKSDLFHCSVCGDKPTGYHYDVLSCNGCKTFFRRTIINKRKFTCSKNGKCEFTKDIRCACRSCRFDKCVRVGMNPKAIQFPTKGEIEDNDDFEQANSSSGGVMVPSTSLDSSRLSSRVNEEMSTCNFIELLIHREQKTMTMRNPRFPIYPMHSLGKILRSPSLLGKQEFDEAINYQEEKISNYERDPVRFWMVADLYLAVEYAKTFDIFRQLSENDQKHLVSHAAGLIQIATQSFYSCEKKSESITFPDGINALKIRLQNTEKARQFEKYYREVYCRPVHKMRELDLTSAEFALFKVIALFSPNDADISLEGRLLIAEERIKLVSQLRRLVMKEYGETLGSQKLANILLAITSFVDHSEKRRLYLQVLDVVTMMNLTSLTKGIFFKKFEVEDQLSSAQISLLHNAVAARQSSSFESPVHSPTLQELQFT